MIESVNRFMPARLVLSPNGLPTATYSMPSSGSIAARLPDAAAVAFAADPGRTGNLPALILLVLRNGVEVPEHLAGLRIHREHVAAGDVTLAARAADIEHAVVDLRRRREPVAHADRRLDVGVALVQNVEDDARLAVLAERRDRLAGLRIEREDERAAGGVDHAVSVGHAAVAEDIALARAAAEQRGDVVDPEQMAVGGVDRVDAAARIGHVHRAVDDDRRGLVADAVDDAVLEQPARRQRLDV